MITNINQLDFEKNYTYFEYLTWTFDERIELLNGKISLLPKSHNTIHQLVLGGFHFTIGHYLKAKNDKIFYAPFDVRLPLPDHKQTKDKIDTVVQPDICVICDLSKLDRRGCNGAPDWIIEILSKGTAKKDLNDKFEIYQNASVREYWIVHPHDETVIPYRLDENGEYQMIQKTPFVRGEKVPVGIFPDFAVPLDNVFTDLDL